MTDDAQTPAANQPAQANLPASDHPDATPAKAAERWTVRRVLEWTTQHLKKHGSASPRLDAEVLLAHARKCRRIELYTAYDEELTDAVRAQMRDLVQRRVHAEPVAYLVGSREFFSLSFIVSRDVLIPRPDTETLVLEALDRLGAAEQSQFVSPQLLDLCTGSGCVAISILKSLPKVTGTASDISAAALVVAKQNADKQGVAERLTFLQGDLFTPLRPQDTFDVIVANPPYIPTAELATLEKDVKDHEPALALDGGPDGLVTIRRLLDGAYAHLKPGGWLLFEITPEQADPILTWLTDDGRYVEHGLRKDLGHTARVVRARRPTDS